MMEIAGLFALFCCIISAYMIFKVIDFENERKELILNAITAQEKIRIKEEQEQPVTDEEYTEVSEMEYLAKNLWNEHLPLCIAFVIPLIMTLIFISGNDGMFALIVWYFIIGGPIALVIQSVVSEHNLKIRHEAGVYNRKADITAHAISAMAAGTVIHTAKRLTSNKTKSKKI